MIRDRGVVGLHTVTWQQRCGGCIAGRHKGEKMWDSLMVALQILAIAYLLRVWVADLVHTHRKRNTPRHLPK